MPHARQHRVRCAKLNLIRQIGPNFLVQAGKLDRLIGPLVTQVQKVRNVTAPKANEESQMAPRMLKLTLTDGVSSLIAIEMEAINHVGFLC